MSGLPLLFLKGMILGLSIAAPVGPTSAQAARGDRMDLGLPTAVATSVSPQPAAASSPAQWWHGASYGARTRSG